MNTTAKSRNTVKAIKLQLSEGLHSRIEYAAQAAGCAPSDVIVAALETGLPPLPVQLPPEMSVDLARWAVLDDEALRAIATAFLPVKKQRRYTTLLRKADAGKLSSSEQMEWEGLQQEYLRVSQNKAKAQYLLTQREKARSVKG